VRVRPLNTKEHAQSEFETIRVLDQKVIVLLDPGNEFESDDVKFLAFSKNTIYKKKIVLPILVFKEK
jgi:hypothetical protein